VSYNPDGFTFILYNDVNLNYIYIYIYIYIDLVSCLIEHSPSPS